MLQCSSPLCITYSFTKGQFLSYHTYMVWEVRSPLSRYKCRLWLSRPHLVHHITAMIKLKCCRATTNKKAIFHREYVQIFLGLLKELLVCKFLNMQGSRRMTFPRPAKCYFLATSNVISGQVLTCDSAHSWRLYSAVPLGDQATSTMKCYPTQSHYPDTEPTCP